ncbi:MAG: glycosyltransferase family 9 protein [Rhodothermaceae bacterium]
MIKKIVNSAFKLFYNVKENQSRELEDVKEILIVRQHNQFGDMLASVSLFRALKEKYSDCKITLIVSPVNYYAVTKNKFIDESFVFDKKKLVSSAYRKKLKQIIKKEYDLAIVPSTVSLSFTSNFIARLANAKTRIGPGSLNGKENKASFFFDRRIKLDWRKNPDAHVSDFGLDIVRPFGIYTKDFTSRIDYDKKDISTAKEFLSSIGKNGKELLIGLHVGAGKPKNRWCLDNYLEVIEWINKNYNCKLFLTGSKADETEINYVKEKCDFDLPVFKDKLIPELTALISRCDLFVTNDTGVMHVAGATRVKQISIFGQTNPFNWAPLGKEKYFLKKSDLISDIKPEDVIDLIKIILKQD